MSPFSGSLKTSLLSEVLQKLVGGRQTGCLKFKEGDQEGYVALENGVILNAATGAQTALHALFELVQWRSAQIEFREKPISPGLARDLAVYDPEVLIAGLAYKEDEMAILHGGSMPTLHARAS